MIHDTHTMNRVHCPHPLSLYLVQNSIQTPGQSSKTRPQGPYAHNDLDPDPKLKVQVQDHGMHTTMILILNLDVEVQVQIIVCIRAQAKNFL
ncbi:hypothetical protein Ddc_12531 [Ditylenchus destructor]|nr:hypothetical protein Ddc_12531 [Ditylenchus destructor]